MSKKIYVIAGTIRQYREYIGQQEDKNYDHYQYLAAVEQLKGLHGIEIVYHGTFEKNPIVDYPELIRQAQLEYVPLVQRIIKKIRKKKNV